ncbi:hypothetical protein NUACC26_031500 [Scytonema sp. NUACC26]
MPLLVWRLLEGKILRNLFHFGLEVLYFLWVIIHTSFGRGYQNKSLLGFGPSEDVVFMFRKSKSLIKIPER